MIKMTGGKQAGQMDLLTGSLGDKILRFAVPLAATGILQQLFNAADIAVIGRFVGKHAMAAVGSNAPLIGLLVNLFLGISMGTNVVVARYIGEGNEANIRKAVHTAIVLALGGGIALTVIGEIVTAPILHLMGVPPEIYDLSVLYMRVYLTGMPVILLYNFESAIFRSRGDTKTPLFCLTISGLINVALNVFFVVVIGMTVNGVALATVISNLISSALLFRFLMKAEGPVRVEPGRLRIHTDVLRLMLQIGIPAGIQSTVFSLANICVQSAVNSLGADVMAGSSAAFNIEIFSYYILVSFGQACTTFVGQNYGAGKMDRCKRTLRLALLQDLAFNTDPAVAKFGMIRLRYIVTAHLFSVFVETISGAMRGYGFSAYPAFMSLFGICGIRIFWVYTVFSRNPVFDVLMMVYPVSIGVTAAAIAAVYFRVTRTKLKEVGSA